MKLLSKELNKQIKQMFETGHEKITIDLYRNGTFCITTEHNPKDSECERMG